MDIRTYLSQGKPLLFDGAMGTYFASLSGRGSERCELANLDHPQEITAIHKAYLDAGCRAITTNTFSVGTDLASGNVALAGDVTAAGCRLAREAASGYEDVFIFACMCPAPQDAPLSPGQIYRRQADLFL